MKHCNRTLTKYLSGSIPGKYNLIQKIQCNGIWKSKKRHRSVYSMNKENINNKKEERRLGLTIMDNMSPEKYINKITGETYNLLRNVWVAFT